MPTKIAVNLPVKDVRESAAFFAALGFPADEQLTSDDTAAHLISEEIYVFLVAGSRFKAITKREIPDTSATCEAIMQLQVENRSRVDELAAKAFAAGALPANDPNDQGFLYGRSFRDLDGHHWDVFCVGPGAAESQS